MKNIKVPSGAEVEIRPADFQDVQELRMAITREAKDVNMDLNVDIEGMTKADMLSKIPQLVLGLDSSKDVNKAIFKCLAQCTRDGHKVTEDTFAEYEARQDYYPIVVECVKVNLAPFSDGLVHLFGGLAEKMMQAQK